MSKELADLTLPNIDKDISYYEELYKPRDLKEGEVVVRFAPSPTGFIHLGSLYISCINKLFRETKGGVFYLRIEDTDKKREVENGISEIVNSLAQYGIVFDEGMVNEFDEVGNYGPYVQSKRKDIYQAYVKYLIAEGKAYPCFCTEDDLNSLREEQEKLKVRTGYYRSFAKCRNLTVDQMIEKIKNGEKYIIRLRSMGDYNKKIQYKDGIKGEIEFPENDQDIVILKSDGLPTYHFAHVVDDHLMRTTHVIRGDEWISSVPLHIQLFTMLGFKVPKYIHVAPIMKEEDGAKRKLSKRKDPEAAVSYYTQEGIPVISVKEYLYNLMNSNFEQWRRSNQDKDLSEFEFNINKMSPSGALFDHIKLLDVSKNAIARMTAQEVYDLGLQWAKIYDVELATLMEKYKDYTINLLDIERTGKKIRKDISKWSDLRDVLEYMYDEIFLAKEYEYVYQTINDKNEITNILNEYIKVYDVNDDKDIWFNKIKDISEKLGYAREVKDYKEHPEKFKGHVGDVSMVIRVAITTRQMTPDLYELLKALGKERINIRIEKYIK
ncbi:MAG: glutamate--tRNA ligase [Clostridia bacterium]|nr:glutamate--tRNA ligase [Clostridia bacterium]